MTFPERYRISFLLCLCNVFSYADRTNIGIVILEWTDLPEQQKGRVLAAFFWGYLLTQIPAGDIARRHGGKIVLLCGISVWTLFDLSTILTKYSGSMALLVISRIGLGLGEG